MFDSLQYDSNTCAPQYELNSIVTMATNWVPGLPIVKAFLAVFGISFDIILPMMPHMIQQAYKYVSLSLWPRLTTKILKSSGWGLEKSELPWEQKFL